MTKPVTVPEEKSAGEVTAAPGVERTMASDESVAAMFSAAYEQLRQLAARARSGFPRATLSPTDLVHEAWFKLRTTDHFVGKPIEYFKSIAGKVMYQVLIEAARRRSAQKRDGGSDLEVSFAAEIHGSPLGAEQLIALDDAITDLAGVDPWQADLVVSRFFGGLGVGEIAQLHSVSESKVERDWRAAKAWLATALR